MMEEDLKKLRHSTAHLLAHAVQELFPETKLTIGPPTKDGFFYDFLPKKNFKEDQLSTIEARMREISKRTLPMTHRQMPKAEARALYAKNPFKLELIDGIEGDTVGIAQQGDFHDLCRGGHVDNTGDIKHFKLLGISGAYWRADRSNEALQRITGTAFFSENELTAFEQRRKDAEKYDHRKLGKQMDLFSFHEEGVGFPFFHPKGKFLFNALVDYMRSLQKDAGYQEIGTPQLLSDSLWRASGHYDHYRDNMYFSEIDKRSYAVKPMNCPGSILVYKERPHSFRELPLRLAEFGLVHRHELSGVLHGLFRVRSFTIDDAHIYCTPDQIEHEITTIMNLIKKALGRFGFSEIAVGLSTRPKKSMGSDNVWEKATQALKNGLDHSGTPYVVQEGEGAFYGPKIEIKIQDSMEREWQCGTIQVDFCMPENLDVSYVASGGKQERPVIIHQAMYGSVERFMAILLEHHKGSLPFWLAPIQARVLTITDAQQEYAQTVAKQLQSAGVRVEVDESGDQITAKIKKAQLDKVPWMLVLGKKEQEKNTVTLRQNTGKQEFNIDIDAIISRAQKLTNDD